jgi:hypothetical protein
MKASSKKQEPDNGPETVKDSGLVSAAKAVGSAAGAIAHLAGVKGEAAPAKAPAPKAQKVGKLPKKNRHRLPRREKKAKAAERL